MVYQKNASEFFSPKQNNYPIDQIIIIHSKEGETSTNRVDILTQYTKEGMEETHHDAWDVSCTSFQESSHVWSIRTIQFTFNVNS